jgi:glycosyltransferase involved in cell wall biosynthesis
VSQQAGQLEPGRESVTIILPCRNEAGRIGACLDSLLGFTDLEAVNWEIWVFDGQSDDDTASLVREVVERETRVKYFLNERRLQGLAVNQSLTEGPGEFLLWLGAHTEYPPDYLARLLETARRVKADIVGGVLETRAGGEGYGATVVQALTTHRFGVGDSGFRTGAVEGPADTVPFALYRREVFDTVGRFDERLERAQDYEFNRRVKAAGGKVWLNPEIKSVYYNQASFGAFIKKQFGSEAPYNVYLGYLAPHAFAWRHWVTGCFALGVIGGLALSPVFDWVRWGFLGVMALYALLALGAAVQQAVRYREARHVGCLPFAFFLFHFLHGLGMWWGVLRLATGTAPVQKISEPWPGAGRKRAWPIPAAGAQSGDG